MKILIIGKYSFIGVNLLNVLRKSFLTNIISSRDFFKNYQKYSHYNYIINCALNKKYITNKYSRKHDLDFKIGCIIKKFKSKYILLSSSKVYRPTNNIKEKNKPNPISNYGKNKFKTEQIMLNLLGNRLLILRISNIIGIRNFNQKRRLHFTYADFFFENLLKKKIFLINDYKIYKDFISINQFCLIMKKIIKNNLYGLYNLSLGQKVYLNEINNWLASQINFELKYIDFNSIGNYNRMKKNYSFTLNSNKLQKKLNISIKKIDLKKDCIKFSKKINFMLN